MWFNLQPQSIASETSLPGTEIGTVLFSPITGNKSNRRAWGACVRPCAGPAAGPFPRGHPQPGLPAPPLPRSSRAVPTLGGISHHPQPQSPQVEAAAP